VFADLTAAYDTAWHSGLTCKLLPMVPYRHMFSLIVEMVGIAVLHLPPEMAKEAGYDVSRTASHRDLSWRPFSSTCTSLTCQPPSPESMHMLTI